MHEKKIIEEYKKFTQSQSVKIDEKLHAGNCNKNSVHSQSAIMHEKYNGRANQ